MRLRPPSVIALIVLAAAAGRAAARPMPAAPAAAIVAQATDTVPQSAILELTLTKGGAGPLTPSLRVPLGSQASVEAAPGVTVSVTQAELNGRQLALRIGVGETMPQGTMESLATIDVPLDKPVKLQLGSDPAASWLIEFTPRVTPAPAKATSG